MPSGCCRKGMVTVADPDFALLEKLIGKELDRRTGSGHGGGGVDGRVSKLESDVKEIKADLKAIGKDVAELKGRAAAMPTMWQLLTMVLTIIAIIAGSFYVTLSRLDRIEAQVGRQENRLDRIDAKLDALAAK